MDITNWLLASTNKLTNVLDRAKRTNWTSSTMQSLKFESKFIWFHTIADVAKELSYISVINRNSSAVKSNGRKKQRRRRRRREVVFVKEEKLLASKLMPHQIYYEGVSWLIAETSRGCGEGIIDWIPPWNWSTA